MSQLVLPRRSFLKGSSIAAGGFLIDPAQLAAQSTSSERVYRSGDTIDDRVGQFLVEGWDVTYPYDAHREYEKKSHRAIEVVLKGNNVIAANFIQGYEFERNGVEHTTLSALPTITDDRAYLHIYEREPGEIGDWRGGKIITERFYAIDLAFHAPEGQKLGVFSEIPLDATTLKQVNDLRSDFWGLTRAPDIYIKNRAQDDPRLAKYGQNPIVPVSLSDMVIVSSFLLTDPNFRHEDIGLSIVYKSLARHLARAESSYGHSDPKLKADLVNAHHALMDAIGFDNEKFEKSRYSHNIGGELSDYKFKILEDQRLHIFDSERHAIVNDGEFWSDAVRYGKPMYTSTEEFLASALTVFRYNLTGWRNALEQFQGLKPEQKRLVAQAGMAVLNYLGSFRESGTSGELAVVRVLPAYHILRNEFLRNLS